MFLPSYFRFHRPPTPKIALDKTATKPPTTESPPQLHPKAEEPFYPQESGPATSVETMSIHVAPEHRIAQIQILFLVSIGESGITLDFCAGQLQSGREIRLAHAGRVL
jgi:hypothetical protein